ncbi:hypothetical protein [Acetobacterium tundrae]|uniref:DUF4352 domain-containing protein n=1 Tax=Acetobacterium tundrae TaxID=132932 RepID=A0ABR6WJ49_9FIRM|nr:hypothetical protein [Acetobacterium tundrae]MBC3796462.1 hypothetical protein [Acetobacterium tundrae]
MKYFFDNWIAIMALVLSITSISLSLHIYWKTVVKLKIAFADDNYCFGFNWYSEYKIAMSYLLIENNSNTDVSISGIELTMNSKTYRAGRIDVQDYRNKNGITLLTNDSSDQYILFNIRTENILDNTRIASNGKIEGYAIFHVDSIIEKQTSCEIRLITPGRSFSNIIILNPLPNNLVPINPLNKH